MNSKLEVLEHLLSFYEGIPQPLRFQYLRSNAMHLGLCKCINHLPISTGLMDDVQHLLYNWATDTGLKKYNTAYFWPTPLECDFEDIISDAITPRINCLKELIKIVNDGTE